MASPFRLFRKYQKAFLAVAAVLAMIIFVFADLLTGALGPSSGGGDNPTVATWDGGSMSAYELDSLSQRRVFISQFLTQLMQTGAMKLMNAGGTPLQPSVPGFILREDATARQVAGECIRTRIFAELGKDAGIQISDAQVNNYLKEISFGQVGGSEIRQLLGPNPGRQEKRLLAGLRELLLSDAYFSSFNNAAQIVTPEERWQDWRSINKRISVEAAILPAARFVSKVEEPSDTELAGFYDEYKDFYANGEQMVMGRRLPSRNPGFREPRRVLIQYLQGDVNSKSIELLDSVTDEEIEEFYERNKRPMFVKQSQEEAANATAEEADSVTESSEDTAAAESEDLESESSDTTDGDAETPATEEPPATDDSSSDQPSDSDSGSKTKRSPFRLVANENETEDTTTEEDSTEEEASPEKEETDASVEEPAEESSDIEDDDDVEFIPLSEVKTSIRQSIATRKAVEALQPIVDKAFAKLESDYRPYSLDLADAEDNGTEAPTPPKSLTDLAALAKETGLIHEKTSLLSARELSETYVGKAMDVINQQVSVTGAAFGDLSLYEPYLAKDLDGNFYIAVKVEDKASRVPELEEIREEVVDAWKLKEAAKMALETSEEYVKEIQESGESFDLFFANKPYERETTDLFSWLTFGSIPLEYGPRAPQLGEAPPLESIGTDFMVKAFELKEGDVAAVMNHDESDAFVIRLAKQEKSDEELQKLFLSEANTSISGYILNQVRAQGNLRGLRSEIINRVNLNTDNLDDYFSRN